MWIWRGGGWEASAWASSVVAGVDGGSGWRSADADGGGVGRRVTRHPVRHWGRAATGVVITAAHSWGDAYRTIHDQCPMLGNRAHSVCMDRIRHEPRSGKAPSGRLPGTDRHACWRVAGPARTRCLLLIAFLVRWESRSANLHLLVPLKRTWTSSDAGERA